MAKDKTEKRRFTDRESGIYGGLMLSIRKYRDRLEVHHGYELNKKPREIDCLIIEKLDVDQPMDNAITAGFRRHNVIEIKNPTETLNLSTVWRVISYTAQYISDNGIPSEEVTMTLIRSSRPNKVIDGLKQSGYRVCQSQPGVYTVEGIVDLPLQIIVTKELVGDDYVPLRLQRKNADRSDYEKFVHSINSTYDKSEDEYVASIIKYGVYDEDAFDAKEGSDMYKKWMEMFKEDLEKAEEKGRTEGRAEGRAEGEAKGRAEGEAKGRAEGEAERKKLEDRIEKLEEQLRKVKVAVL